MLSSFTHPHVVLNMYDFSSIVVNKEIFFCPYYKSEWSSFFFLYTLLTLIVMAKTNETFLRIYIFSTEERKSGMIGRVSIWWKNFHFWVNYPFISGGCELNSQLEKRFPRNVCANLTVIESQCINEVECTATAGLMFMQKHPPHTHTHTQLPPPSTATPCQVRSSGRPWACPARGSCCANISVSLNGSLTCCLFGLASCFHQNQYVAQEWESNDWNARLSIGITHQSVLTWRGCVDIGVVERIG